MDGAIEGAGEEVGGGGAKDGGGREGIDGITLAEVNDFAVVEVDLIEDGGEVYAVVEATGEEEPFKTEAIAQVEHEKWEVGVGILNIAILEQ